MAKEPKLAPTIFDQAWRRSASRLQLDQDKDDGNGLAKLQALKQRLKEGQKPRSA
jgi:hypothetical protein